MKYLQDALKRLEMDASRRRERLQENASLLQFMWKGDVVESWISKFRFRERISGDEHDVLGDTDDEFSYLY